MKTEAARQRAEKTQWFPATKRPRRVGVYQKDTSTGVLVYSRWDGKFWHMYSIHFDVAARSESHSSEQCCIGDIPWRGLAHEPN